MAIEMTQYNTINDLLAQHADASNIAIKTETNAISYQNLHQQTNQVANYLHAQGVGQGNFVGIYFSRKIEMVIAILAVLKTGAAYVPLDPSYPLSRNTAIVNDLKPSCLLGEDIPDEWRLISTAIEYTNIPQSDYSAQAPDVVLSSNDIAYVLYTSGTTGVPKGIFIEHHSVVNLLTWAMRQYNMDEITEVLFASSICFDLSVFECFLPLVTGNTIFLAQSILDLEKKSPAHQQIRLINTVPSAIQQLLQHRCIPESVMTINLAGEQLTAKVTNALYATTSVARIYNCYGPSETTTYATCYLVPNVISQEIIPIGLPIDNTQVLVVDTKHQIMVTGEVGELVIAGSGVMRGYVNQAEPFITINKTRYYPTGDRGYQDAAGLFYFQGRRDRQIKWLGYRVELNEIELVLQLHPKITAVASVATGDILAAFIMGSDITEHELQQFTAEKLPHYMNPTKWIIVSQLPQLPNGKIDYSALQQHPSLQTTSQRIMAIWEVLLHRDDINNTDNFFDVGGHSLLLTVLQTKISAEFSREVTRVDLLANPSIAQLANFIDNSHANTAEKAIINQSSSDIGIIGISVRVADANTPDEFWQNICLGKRSIKPINGNQHQSTDIVNAAAIVDGIEQFDANFFKLSQREAAVLDPQQRLLLECCWHALEDAGIASLAAQRVGVFSAIEMSQYLQRNLQHLLLEQGGASAYQIRIANDKDFAATRIAYQLNLQGPAVNVQTACSSSLVAVHMAMQSLQRGECDFALVCAASLHIPQQQGYQYQEGLVGAIDGYCRAFDETASGTVFGNGAAAILLTADVSHYDAYALLKGSAINNDASDKVSYTAPSVSGQVSVIQQAQKAAGIKSETIDFVEGHGTGTVLGDAVELTALTQAFRKNNRHQCALGSIKPNIGHLDAAAGLAGLIKTTLAIYHNTIPPNIDFTQPNQALSASPFYVPTAINIWPKHSHPRRAAVSSFGVGGTNAHVILEQAPENHSQSDTAIKLFVLSAKTQLSLRTQITHFIAWLQQYPDVNIDELCYTLQVGRAHFAERIVMEVATVSHLMQELQTVLASQFTLTFQHSLAIQYTQGDTIDWLAQYDPQNLPKRIHLPTYVFDKQRCWIEPVAVNASSTTLLGNRLPLPCSEQIRFDNWFTPDFPAYNNDHRIFGKIVVPGSSHVAMFLTAMAKVGRGQSITLSDFTFTKPLTLTSDEKRHVQLIIDPIDTQYTLKLVSIEGDSWHEHACAIAHCDGIDHQTTVNTDAIQQRCSNSYSGDHFYQQVWAPGADTGHSFHWLKMLWVGERECLATIEQPENITFHQEIIHAGVIESGLQLLNACWGELAEDEKPFIYVPFAMHELVFDTKINANSKAHWAYVSISHQSTDGERINANVFLLDEQGQHVLSIQNFQVKKLYQNHLSDPCQIYTLEWMEHQTTTPKNHQQVTLNQIAAQTQAFWQGQVDHTKQCWFDLTKKSTTDVFASNLMICQQLRDCLNRLNSHDKLADVELIFILDLYSPLCYASLMGYIRTARNELGVTIRCIQVDILDENVIAQIQSLKDLPEAKIENYKVSVPSIVNVNRMAEQQINIVQHGSYLITGGFGSLGMHMAHWLISQGVQHLIILGRSPLNQTKLQQLKQPGMDVEYHQLDVTQKSQLSTLSLRRLKGVIHCAGALHDGSITTQSDADLYEVFAPKIQGVLNLHEVTKQLQLDFFINFSSITSIQGVAGQSNYAAANAFLDAFAYYRQQQGLPCLTINWDLWQDSVMHQAASKNKRTPMTIDEALQAFSHCQLTSPQLIITKENLHVQAEKKASITLPNSGSVLSRLCAVANHVLGAEYELIDYQEQGLAALGLDSLMAVEFRALVQKTFKVNVPVTFAYDYPLLSQAAKHIEALLQSSAKLATTVLETS